MTLHIKFERNRLSSLMYYRVDRLGQSDGQRSEQVMSTVKADYGYKQQKGGAQAHPSSSTA